MYQTVFQKFFPRELNGLKDPWILSLEVANKMLTLGPEEMAQQLSIEGYLFADTLTANEFTLNQRVETVFS